MARYCWLASYPKSGNTWFRMVTANLHAKDNETVDINNLPNAGNMASAREIFDNILLVESGILTHEEVDRMRPPLHRFLATEEGDEFLVSQELREESDQIDSAVGLFKTHDAYTKTDIGEPLLGGEKAAIGAIVIVRDPRDVAPSFAHHGGGDIDQAIDSMADSDFGVCTERTSQPVSLRQQLLSWSGWHASWLEQQDIPIHLLRYEDMKTDPLATIGAALEFAGYPTSNKDLARAVEMASFERLQSKEAESGFREAPKGRNFFRKGQSGGWREELTQQQVARIEKDHAAMMVRLGYKLCTNPARGDAVSVVSEEQR